MPTKLKSAHHGTDAIHVNTMYGEHQKLSFQASSENLHSECSLQSGDREQQDAASTDCTEMALDTNMSTSCGV